MTSLPESTRNASSNASNQRRNLALLAWIAAVAVLAVVAHLYFPTVKASEHDTSSVIAGAPLALTRGAVVSGITQPDVAMDHSVVNRAGVADDIDARGASLGAYDR